MKNNDFLQINNLSVSVNDKAVLHNINLKISSQAIHAIMGPNGSGKSSLAYSLMGHPSYTITSGSILLNDFDISTAQVHERAKKGLFLSFQHPCEIPGVSVAAFLKEGFIAITGQHISVADFQKLLTARCEQLLIDPSFIQRSLEGFSGGEKKKLELLQLLLLKPKVAILDEIDSGLDIDALKIVAAGIELACTENSDMTVILITHYQRILNYIVPDYVHVLCDGKIVSSGDAQVAQDLETKGYDGFKNINL
ncbi:MAG TPA: Fe-S cluster assembly ATPase SufC [Candidatus Babeliales bacterium]|jgi:Fe-S cluster assembly ATP-binding protein|nr:Fe-S cluster assembly ATPase SufC [Candidatus Babeliales bacterium]